MTDETKNMSDVVAVYNERRKLEKEGVWCNLACGRVKIKSAVRNPEFARKVKPFAENMGDLQEDDKVFAEIVQILSETIVLDWDGFGADYTPEGFVDVCSQLKDCGFAEDVLQFVMDKDLFSQVAVAKSAKN